MSRAVVTWSSSGRPEAFWKTVCVMPSWRALAVIICANLVSLPAMWSAMATATSLADFVISTLMASIRAIFSPGSKSSLEGATAAAAGVISICVWVLSRPWASCSNTI